MRESDFAFANQVRAAVELRTPRTSRMLLAAALLLLITGTTWAHFAILDEVKRGQGRVIPSRQIQVLQSLEGALQAAMGRDDHADDRDAAEEGQQVAGGGEVAGQRAAQREVEQRERADADQQSEAVGDAVAHDQAEIPEPVTHHRPAERQRHGGERRHRDDGERLRRPQAGEIGQAVEQQERQIAAGGAHHQPEQLAVLLPVGGRADPLHQHDDRGGGERGEMRDLDPVEPAEQRGGRPAGEPGTAVQGEIALRQTYRRVQDDLEVLALSHDPDDRQLTQRAADR